jgi:hypothetical protein
MTQNVITYQTNGLGDQGPDAHEPTNDEASEHSLDLGYTTLLSICRESGDKICSNRCKQNLKVSAPAFQLLGNLNIPNRQGTI